MANDLEFYKSLKLAGFLVYIPIVLVSGPLAGYVAGDYLIKKFNLPDYIGLFSIALGFLSSIMETIRIIKLAKKIEK